MVSKSTPSKKKVNIEDIKEAAVVNLVNTLQEKTFNSGKTGFYSQGKITVDGDRYQSQIMLVKIEPKG
jgi:hypothetical protein